MAVNFREMIMSRRGIGLQSDRLLELADCLGDALLIGQYNPQSQMCLPVRGITHKRSPVVVLCLSQIPLPAREFTQIEVCQTMAAFLCFLLQPPARVLGILLPPVDIANRKIAVWYVWILLQSGLILSNCLIKLLLIFIRVAH